MVAIGGSPLKAGEAFGSVFAAALANGGSFDNIAPGIEFFGKLAKRRQLQSGEGRYRHRRQPARRRSRSNGTT